LTPTIIIPIGAKPLVIDTGLNAESNSRTLEAVGDGGLEIHSDVVNSGLTSANGGNVKAGGSVEAAPP